MTTVPHIAEKPLMARARAERRTRNRIKLAQPIVGRVNSWGALVLDISESGARIEHFQRLQTGSEVTLRFDWDGQPLAVECRVVSCRVHRFAAGEEGITIYQSGLMFVDPRGEAAATLKKLTSTFVARALAEQVANAKGVMPTFKEDAMPIFRAGVLSSDTFDSADTKKNRHLIPVGKLVTHRGYIRCTLDKESFWKKHWTTDPAQPREGFTISVHEPMEQVELLCETYRTGAGDTRRLIRKLAAMSIENSGDDLVK